MYGLENQSLLQRLSFLNKELEERPKITLKPSKLDFQNVVKLFCIFRVYSSESKTLVSKIKVVENKTSKNKTSNNKLENKT